MTTDFEIAFAIKQLFDEMLDDCYPVYEMGNAVFYPSQILKDCDPIAYNEALLDFEDNYLKDNADDLERLMSE
jgi:hypothetical protein